jgi:hypothetical protein
MDRCFGPLIAGDKEERGFRFLEESLELVQSTGCSKEDAHKLVDYVYGRPVGEIAQEVGGVSVTLAALCQANGVSWEAAAVDEYRRINTREAMLKIQQKQLTKPQRSPLPGHTVPVQAFYTHNLSDDDLEREAGLSRNFEAPYDPFDDRTGAPISPVVMEALNARLKPLEQAKTLAVSTPNGCECEHLRRLFEREQPEFHPDGLTGEWKAPHG